MPKRKGVFFWDSFPKPDTERELMIFDFMYFSGQMKLPLDLVDPWPSQPNEVSG